jgi:hypothetical protein
MTNRSTKQGEISLATRWSLSLHNRREKKCKKLGNNVLAGNNKLKKMK